MKINYLAAPKSAVETSAGGTARLAAVAVAATLMLCLFGCNTFEGVGEDMEAAGDKIEETAEENKNY